MARYTCTLSNFVASGALPPDFGPVPVYPPGSTLTVLYHWATINPDGTIDLRDKRTISGSDTVRELWIAEADVTLSGALQSWDDTMANPCTAIDVISGYITDEFLDGTFAQISGSDTTFTISSPWGFDGIFSGADYLGGVTLDGDSFSGSGNFPDGGPVNPVGIYFNVSSSADYDTTVRVAFVSVPGINVLMPDQSWRTIGTDTYPAMLRMPDGTWRTYQSSASTWPLKVLMADGTWKTVSFSDG